jgi:hypothetical protein
MSEIIALAAWATEGLRTDILKRNIEFLKRQNLPILLVGHHPFSQELQNMVDYCIYDKRNILSNKIELSTMSWIDAPNFQVIYPTVVNKYHAASCYQSFKNTLRFCDKKFSIVHHIESDHFISDEYFTYARNELKTKKLVCFNSVFPDSIYGGLFSCDCSFMNSYIEDIDTWEDYEKINSKIGSNLIGETFIFKYYQHLNILDDCSISKDRKQFMIFEDALMMSSITSFIITETITGKLLLFISRGKDFVGGIPSTYKLIDRATDNIIASGFLLPCNCIWYLLEKEDKVIKCYSNGNLVDEIIIDKNITYKKSLFKFQDDTIKCISWSGIPGEPDWDIKYQLIQDS